MEKSKYKYKRIFLTDDGISETAWSKDRIDDSDEVYINGQCLKEILDEILEGRSDLIITIWDAIHDARGYCDSET